MQHYFTTLLDEKGINLQSEICVFDEEGVEHFMTVENVVEHVSVLPEPISKKIKSQLVGIDFMNGNLWDYLEFLARGMAKGAL